MTNYLVERCQGAGCTGFAQIGTLGDERRFSNTGLTASTSYSYRVRATDAAGNLSGYSNTATATTPGGALGADRLRADQRRGAADAADDGDGAVHGGAERRAI